MTETSEQEEVAIADTKAPLLEHLVEAVLEDPACNEEARLLALAQAFVSASASS